MDKANDTFKELSKYINIIINENSCTGNDSLMDYTSLLESALEEFSNSLENLEIEINKSEVVF